MNTSKVEAQNLKALVFSDLDGSLLDHYTYSFQAALPAVRTLEQRGIPLILVSSKTRAEIVALRNDLNIHHPLIVENGAAVFIPHHYFSQQPAGTELRKNYWVHKMAPARSRWLAELASLESEFGSEFTSFYQAGIAGIMEMTGLSEAQAAAANERDYSEPIQWRGNPQRALMFIERLRNSGATVVKGGRFYCVSGQCDKGQALHWLQERYQEACLPGELAVLAIGDSANDVPMLEAAQTALLIRSPVHDFPSLTKTNNVIHSQSIGPSGWAEGVSKWLQLNEFTD